MRIREPFLVGAVGLCLLGVTALFSADAPAATATAPEPRPKTGHTLFENISGFGGSVMVAYGNGSPMNDTVSVGLRGFVHFNNLRFGAIGTMTRRTNNPSTGRDMTGSIGFFGEYLLRFDPFIIGVGAKAAGAGYSSHDYATRTSGTKYAYFNAMPFAELEFRLFEHMSLGIYGGYDYFVGNAASPSISEAVGGVAITIARY